MTGQQPTNQQPPFDYQKWLHEMKRQDTQRAHDKLDDFAQQANRSAVENANLAIRLAVLINGGAAVAVLGFIGALASQGRLKLGADLVSVSSSLTWFAIGVALATLAMGFSYFTNYGLAAHASNQKKNWERPLYEETPASKRWKCFAIFFQLLAIVAAFGSVGLFVAGMLAVKNAITHLA